MGKKQTLCKWDKDKIEKDLKKLRKIVCEPQFVCKRCARVAVSSNNLCKAINLND